MKNDPEDIRQTAAGDPHYAGTEPDGGCRGGRGIPELCLSAGTGQVCAEHHGGAAAGKGTACAGGASAPHRTGIEKAEVCIMKIKIGTVIENHLIYAIYGTEHCIARPILPDGEFVVWHIDAAGKGVWGGSYFPDQMDAERAYVTRCFPWLSDNVLFAASEEDDEIDETFAEFPDLP